MKGTVKWFNNKLGYGFIEPRYNDRDIFVHFTEIQTLGYKFLKEGDIVEFDFDKDNCKATNVKVIKKASHLKSLDRESNYNMYHKSDWRK